MSITVTITNNKPVLETYFQPPLNVTDEFECGLLYFSVINSVPNITEKNNTFVYGNPKDIIKIPNGVYDLFDIGEYIQNNVTDCEFKLRPNNNTLTCSVFCTKVINFEDENSIGRILGFDKVKLDPYKWHESVKTANILPLSVIRVECDLIKGSYTNGIPSHTIYEFIPNVPPGYRYIEVPQNIIYFPVNKYSISSITVKVVDEYGSCINFKDEHIQLRLHIRKVK